jgi:hypothetical protein
MSEIKILGLPYTIVTHEKKKDCPPCQARGRCRDRAGRGGGGKVRREQGQR